MPKIEKEGAQSPIKTISEKLHIYHAALLPLLYNTLGMPYWLTPFLLHMQMVGGGIECDDQDRE